jgi:anhydro-N-acetylmuramic acid kinase
VENIVSEAAESDEILVVGLMSGTSTDGVDAALVGIRGDWSDPQIELKHWLTEEYDTETRNRLLSMYPPNLIAIEDLSRLNVDLGEIYAAAVLRLLGEAGVEPSQVLGIGSRGVTIGHFPPPPGRSDGHRIEIAEASVIAERTGISVCSDSGMRDMAAGGHGVLASTVYTDWLLFHDDEHNYAVQNIGGISNVAHVRAGVPVEEVMSFDTGPGNVFMDFAAFEASDGAQTYDRDGLLARQGTVSQTIVDELLEHPFFDIVPPKSTGRELFGVDMWNDIKKRGAELGLNKFDLVATVTAFTAQAIKKSYDSYVFPAGPVDTIVLDGGGAYNPVLVEMLSEQMAPRRVMLHDEQGVPAAVREAFAWAVVAARNFQGLPTGLPHVSGARRSVVFGKFSPGAFNWDGIPFAGAKP